MVSNMIVAILMIFKNTLLIYYAFRGSSKIFEYSGKFLVAYSSFTGWISLLYDQLNLFICDLKLIALIHFH